MTPDLFPRDNTHWRENIGRDAVVLRNFINADAPVLLAELNGVIAAAPLRHMVTARGFTMSVAMTNCGDYGWYSDRSGYRYSPLDPETGQPWPDMPAAFKALAQAAAASAGFGEFLPDACLINRYKPGARLSLHQDKNERDFRQPIVSVSLGLAATFLFGGPLRTSSVSRIPLTHGDVVVWGGATRMHYHGVAPLKAGAHPDLGECRINLTFRKAT